jgi:hypothetical protein
MNKVNNIVKQLEKHIKKLPSFKVAKERKRQEKIKAK